MPREACEFCRRARARHKTRKKVGIFWHNSRGLNRIDWKQKMSKSHQKSPAVLVIQNNRNETGKVDKQNRLEINHNLQNLIDLLQKENEIEEVTSPKGSASILSESTNNVEAMNDSSQSPILIHARNQISKETISLIDSKSAEKPSLANFKIAEITLQQCANLLQSFSINSTENSYR